MSRGLFYFKFMDSKDMKMVLAISWSYGKHNLMVVKWHPMLDLVKELNKMTLVWVRLLGLPLEFWDERILISIGNSFRHFFVADTVTLQKSRLMFARLSVNIAVGTSLPKSIILSVK